MNFFFKLLLLTTLLLFNSCKSDENNDNDNATKAKPIYNQAYQENFEEDKIPDIINNAHNGFVIIDPFQDDNYLSISAIKANGNEVCGYISIGTGENWRLDFMELEPYLVTTVWGQWAGEYFVNLTTNGILPIMKARITQLADWGCTWVEFDNMDWIYDDELRTEYGFQVTEAEGIAYFNELKDFAHSKGLKCLAKNTVVDASNFDGALYESYNDEKNWWNQSAAQSFLDADKLVIINHYNETNCNGIYAEYKGIYNRNLSFICEDSNLQRYVHYNE